MRSIIFRLILNIILNEDEAASFDCIGNLTVNLNLFIEAGRDGERKIKRLSQLKQPSLMEEWSQM